MYSLVLNHELQCGLDARFEVQGTKGYGIQPNLPFSSGQRQPKGNNRHSVDDLPMVLVNNSTEDEGMVSRDLFDGQVESRERHVEFSHETRMNHIGREGVLPHQAKLDEKTREEQRGGNINELTSGWLHHDEVRDI
jgi:hypothetical protein